MSLRINHNIASIDGHRQLLANSTAVSKSLEKLSSGLRINHAADDAAGLVISEQMRAQITGLDSAVSNSETAVSMVQTAEGALDEINSLLKQVRQLALHAANEGANDVNQLVADQKEVDNAVASITRISAQTQFGTKKLLDGSLAAANSYDTTKVTKFDVGGDLLARADFSGGAVSVVVDTSAETSTTIQLSTSNSGAIGAGGLAASVFSGVTGLASFFATSTAGLLAGASMHVRIGDTVLSFDNGVSVQTIVASINAAQSQYTMVEVSDTSGGFVLYENSTGTVGARGDISIVLGVSNGASGLVYSVGAADVSASYGYNQATTIKTSGGDTLSGIAAMVGSATATTAIFTAADGTAAAVPTADYKGTLGIGTTRLVAGASLTFSVAGKDYSFSSGETVDDMVSYINNAQTDYSLQTDRDHGLTLVRNKLGAGGTTADFAIRATTKDGTTGYMHALSTSSVEMSGSGAATAGLDIGVNVTAHITGTGLPGGRINLTSTSDDGSILKNNAYGLVIDATNAFARSGQSITANMTRGALFQVGPNNGQKVGIDIKDVAATALGLDGDKTGVVANLQALTTKQALVNGYQTQAVSVIDKAIDDVTNLRGQLGGFQANTLESGLNSLRVTNENLTAAESTIRDVDFAGESANFTKNQILVQASTAMLAQANQLPQAVLKLLG